MSEGVYMVQATYCTLAGRENTTNLTVHAPSTTEAMKSAAIEIKGNGRYRYSRALDMVAWPVGADS